MMTPSSITSPNAARNVIRFRLGWWKYAIVYFLVVGTSLAWLGGIFLAIVLIDWVTAAWFSYLCPALLLLGFGYRLVQSTRPHIVFELNTITVHSSQWRGRFTWEDVQQIELQPTMIAVQFPTTTLVFQTTTQQHSQFQALVSAQSRTVGNRMQTSVVFQDLRGHQAPTFGSVVYYGLAGVVIGGLLSLFLGDLLFGWFSLEIMILYILGYLVWGGIRIKHQQQTGVILTQRGVLELAFPKQALSSHVSQVTRPSQNSHLIPWIRWQEVIRFGVYFESIVLESPQGQLEVKGAGVRTHPEIVDQVLRQLQPADQWTITHTPLKYQYKKRKVYHTIQYAATLGERKQPTMFSTKINN